MGSEASLSVPLVTLSCAWRKGLRTPRTGGEWREHLGRGQGEGAKGAGAPFIPLALFG